MPRPKMKIRGTNQMRGVDRIWSYEDAQALKARLRVLYDDLRDVDRRREEILKEISEIDRMLYRYYDFYQGLIGTVSAT